jgi:hypothetical protein
MIIYISQRGIILNLYLYPAGSLRGNLFVSHRGVKMELYYMNYMNYTFDKVKEFLVYKETSCRVGRAAED